MLFLTLCLKKYVCRFGFRRTELNLIELLANLILCHRSTHIAKITSVSGSREGYGIVYEVNNTTNLLNCVDYVYRYMEREHPIPTEGILSLRTNMNNALNAIQALGLTVELDWNQLILASGELVLIDLHNMAYRQS